MLLLKNGMVFNSETGEFSKQDLYIEGHHIQKIAPNIVIENVETLNCEGKWLIPGLIDMHVHIKDHFANYFSAAGVTTVRNTAGSVIELQKFMEADGAGTAPRVISADRMIDGPPGLWGADSPYNVNVSTPEAAKAEVERQINLNTEFIKVYGWLEPEIMQVVVAEAKKYGKEVSSDLIYSKKVNAIDAAKMGIDWLEHASGVVQAMYPEWSMDATAEVWNQIPWGNPDDEKIKMVCEQLVKYNVKLCPTVVLYDQMRLAEDFWRPDHEVEKHIAESYQLKHWQALADMKLGQSTLGIQTKMIQRIAYIYAEMGGTVVTGTDTPAGIYTYPGLALHRELQLFVEAGFSSLDALQSATKHAAEALGRNDLGMLKENNVADVLVLESNPIERIEHTLSIEQIIKNGLLYSPQELMDQLPTEEEAKERMNEMMERFKELQLM